MTVARQLLPHATYLVTRRCTQRQFWLRPEKNGAINDLFKYLLAVACEKTNVTLHAVCVLSNHYHLLLTDPDARLPEFMHFLNRHTALGINKFRQRIENLWASGGYSAVRCETDADVVDKLLYTWCNPVSSGLTRHRHSWPGLLSNAHAWSTPGITLSRPLRFFRDDSALPHTATFTLTRPAIVERTSTRHLITDLTAHADAREAELIAQRLTSKKGFMKRADIFEQRLTASASSHESLRDLNPHIACKDPVRFLLAVARLNDFRLRYREAYHRWRHGNRDVLFPAGTYGLRVTAGVGCCDFA